MYKDRHIYRLISTLFKDTHSDTHSDKATLWIIELLTSQLKMEMGRKLFGH